MWLLVRTQTDALGECLSPARVTAEAHASWCKAYDALRAMFSADVMSLSLKLDYSDLSRDQGSARIVGNNQIIVLAIREIMDDPNKQE